jgi:calcium-translocating P-type ATPase
MPEQITKDSLAEIRTEADIKRLGGVKGIVAAVGTDLDKGMPSAAVVANREKYGENRLPEKEARSFWEHFKEAFEDTTLRILIFSAVSSISFGLIFNEDSTEIVQGAAILFAVALVSMVNSFQNWSKDREFQSLAKLKEDRSVRVLRDGKEISLSVYELVVGDILILESGEGLPADGILTQGYEIQVDTSSMTGESLPVPKSATGDCCLVGSCLIREGEGRMLVTAVGLNSQMGVTITSVENEEIENTPLQVRSCAWSLHMMFAAFASLRRPLTLSLLVLPSTLSRSQDRLEALAEDIGKVGTAAGALTFIVLTALWFLRDEPNKSYQDLLKFFIVGVAIVVVAVPEGLPLAVTISLAFSMRRMMKDNNLVRQLQACETMGSATVIASDKTGTLTENRMAVSEAWAFGRYFDSVDKLAAGIASPGAEHRLAKAICLNTSATLNLDGPRPEFIGNPTEGALLYMVMRNLRRNYVEERATAGAPLHRRPFNKENKYMTTLCKSEDSGDAAVAYVKGASEAIIDVCKYVQYPDGKTAEITSEMRFNLNELVEAMASKGLRTLSVAYKRVPKNAPGVSAGNWSDVLQTAEKEMTLIGIFGLEDPLREGVSEAVARCRSAGIRVMMITGDHPTTAKHIAQKAGIVLGRSGELVLEGPAFRAMPDEDKKVALKNLAVLARSSPMDKHKVVELLKEMGEVVAVTGDGTNDAPALRAADVGLAMGMAGTEVAKEAADIVILDDRFSSIVASVRWGRSIKENIRKFLTFQLTINIVALTLTFLTACMNNGSTAALPLKPVQLLWVNCIMDSFAALALATEPPSEKLMEYAPQGKNEKLITRTMLKNMIGHAVFQTVLLIWLDMTDSGATFLGAAAKGSVGHHTSVFTAFVALQVFNLFNCRTVHDEWNVLQDFSSSVVAQIIVAIIIVMQFIIVQFGGALTSTEPLTAGQWTVCVALGFLSVPVGYLLKLVPACENELLKLAPTPLTAEQIRMVDAPVAESLRTDPLSPKPASAGDAFPAPSSNSVRKRKNTRG